jgi:hypothetical protein
VSNRCFCLRRLAHNKRCRKVIDTQHQSMQLSPASCKGYGNRGRGEEQQELAHACLQEGVHLTHMTRSRRCTVVV